MFTHVHIFPQCPFCSKAFLNSSFLQSHIHRRHGEYSPSSKDSQQTDQGMVPSPAGPQAPEIEQELNEIRERLKHTETELRHEKKARKMLQQVCVHSFNYGIYFAVR